MDQTQKPADESKREDEAAPAVPSFIEADEEFEPAGHPESFDVEEGREEVLEEDVPPAEKPRPGFWTRAARVLLVLLIFLGLGAVLVLFTLYLPTQEKLSSASGQISNLQATVTQQEARIQELSALETTNEELRQQADQARLHVSILRSHNDVTTALLALEREDASAARVALSRTDEDLENIAEILGEEQMGVVDEMQERLTLAIEGIQEAPYFAAKSDLNVLSNQLMQLENTFFSNR